MPLSRSEPPLDPPPDIRQTNTAAQLPFNTLSALHNWLSGPLRVAIPHEAALCGLAQRHALGYSPVRVVAIGLPDSYLAEINAFGDQIHNVALERWMESGMPQFLPHGPIQDTSCFREDPACAGDSAALNSLHRYGLRNVAVAGHNDPHDRQLSFFCLYNLLEAPQPATEELLAMLAPMVHATLVAACAEHKEIAAGTPHPDLGDHITQLTGKEREVLEQVRLGHSNKQIGKLLNKSPLTVKTQVRSLLAKLRVPNRTALASQAYKGDAWHHRL